MSLLNGDHDAPQFGSVLARRGPEHKVWWFIVPGALALGALLVFAGIALSKASGLETQLASARAQAAEAQKAADERDKLLQAARADEDVLKSAGRGAALLVAASREAPQSGVAVYHPERHAVKVFAFGLTPPPQGQQYQVEAVAGEERKLLGSLSVDDKGGAFLLSKEVPEAANELAVRLGDEVLLSGALPRAGQAGIVEPPEVQARTPQRTRR